MAVAIAVGVAFGLARAQPAGAGNPTLRWLPLLVAAAVAQWLPELVDVAGIAGAAVVASHVALVAFAAANVRVPGMWVVLLGVGLNLVVIVPNAGMPVRADAIVRAGIAEAGEVAGMGLGAKRHLESVDDVLTGLGDVVPIRPLREVVSVGDLVLAAGVALVTSRVLRTAHRPAPSATVRADDLDGGGAVEASAQAEHGPWADGGRG